MKRSSLVKLFSVAVAAVLAFSVAFPALAETSAPGIKNTSSAEARKRSALSDTIARATTLIDKRIADLNALIVRIGTMKRVSETATLSITTSVRAEISALSELKAKISADSEESVLKTDIRSITAGNRVYLLVMPVSRILAAADKTGELADSMAGASVKIASRIAAAEAAGKDVAAALVAETDMDAKIADAKIQAAAAVSAVAGLVPDNGNKDVALANKAALESAHKYLSAASADLRGAEKDMRTIAGVLKEPKAKPSINA